MNALSNTQEFNISYEGDVTKKVNKVFHWLMRGILAVCFFCIVYCLFASERYVSEATILIQNTEQVSTPSLDITTFLSGLSSSSSKDQLLLSEHLLSVDMLKKIDANIDLKKHYSNKKIDLISRMWLGKYYIEWFHRYYLKMVSITYDEYNGVLRIETQAYDPETAYSIANLLVKYGEKFMNDMSHELARVQIEFLEKQVEYSQKKVWLASKALLDFQNNKGLASPKVAAESINQVISKLENQRTELQTQLTALPKYLDKNHPTKENLQNSLYAVETQILKEKAKLASSTGEALNLLIERENELELELKFKTDLYKTALTGLEKGRIDASRTIKQISILQKPVFPEYAKKPERAYWIITILIIALIALGITNLLKLIILDHVD